MRFFSNIRPTRLSCSRETLPHGDAAQPLGTPFRRIASAGFLGSALLTAADPIPHFVLFGVRTGHISSPLGWIEPRAREIRVNRPKTMALSCPVVNSPRRLSRPLLPVPPPHPVAVTGSTGRFPGMPLAPANCFTAPRHGVRIGGLAPRILRKAKTLQLGALPRGGELLGVVRCPTGRRQPFGSVTAADRLGPADVVGADRTGDR